MDTDHSPAPSEEPLHEFMEEKVKIEGGINPAREQELGALLQSLPGVRSITVIADEVSITYEPTEITSREMHQNMRGAGFTPAEREVAPSEPRVTH